MAKHQSFNVGRCVVENKAHLSVEHFDAWGVREIGVKDKVTMLDPLQIGQDVTVHFNVRCREYQGRYYTNLTAWRIQAEQTAPPAQPPQAPPPPPGPAQVEPQQPQENSEIPF